MTPHPIEMRAFMLLLFGFGFGCISAAILAPLVTPSSNALLIPDHYIVTLKAKDETGMNSINREQHFGWLSSLLRTESAMTSSIIHTFSLMGAFGYTGKFSKAVLVAIRKRSEVEMVEQDQWMYALDGMRLDLDLINVALPFSGLVPKNLRELFERILERNKRMQLKGVELQADAPWGLSRVSYHERPLEFGNYTYPKSAGGGVDVYVIDTGINIRHRDFEGRASWGTTIPAFDEDIDGNGHGTHCAGVIGGRTFGIAKKARLIAVKVLRTNGFGTNSDVIKGIEWVIKSQLKNRRKGRRAVANMSLGGGRSLSLEKAVNRAVKAGVHFAVAAGNDNEDACNYSPAAASGPITVGASTNIDEIAFFSNHGPCVDIFAPGMDITSAWIGSDDAVNTASGTSMASPHVAGVLALHLADKEHKPEELKKLLISHATKDALMDVPAETANCLLSIEPLNETLKD